MYKKSISPEEIDKLPFASFPGEIRVIDALGPDYDAAIRYLRRQKVIGFDTETRPTFMPNQPRSGVALLQLSGSQKAFLFRVNRIGIPRSLASVLHNPAILKIGAAVHDDVRGLQKLRGFDAGGFVDLQKLVAEYGIMDKSVKKMSSIILGLRVSKSQQLSNWEAERLSDGQQMYAACDAWICREMYLALLPQAKNPLVHAVDGNWYQTSEIESGEVVIVPPVAEPAPAEPAPAPSSPAKKRRRKYRKKRKAAPKTESEQ